MMRRIIAILLSLVMTLGMGITAYADPEEDTPVDVEMTDMGVLGKLTPKRRRPTQQLCICLAALIKDLQSFKYIKQNMKRWA